LGSASIAGWIAQITFVVVLLVGWEDLGLKGRILFIGLWLAGRIGLAYLSYGAALFTPYVALLDIVLVFVVFKGDVQLR
jgi:hypothetical protein